MDLSAPQFWSQFLQRLITSIPTLTVAVIGIIFCLSALSRHRAAALMGLSGFLLLLVAIFGMAALWSWMPIFLRDSGTNAATCYSLLGFGSSVLSALVYGILLAAIFIGRKPAGGV